MINLKLDEQEAWFLTQILENSLEKRTLFKTMDENDRKTFDEDFYTSVSDTMDKLLKARGF